MNSLPGVILSAFLLFLHGSIFPGSILANSSSVVSLSDDLHKDLFIYPDVDYEKPVLLFLHGGNSIDLSELISQKNPELTEHFTLIDWNQGADQSEGGADELFLEDFIEDALAVTLWLKRYFRHEKVYLLAHSFGTVPGILLAHRYPEHFKAYISVGQVVAQSQVEQAVYDFALRAAIRHQRSDISGRLSLAGRPDDEGVDHSEYGRNAFFNLTVAGYFGGLYTQCDSSENKKHLWCDLSERGDRLLANGYFQDDAVWAFNAFEDALTLDVPAYFLSGVYDQVAPAFLQKPFFDALHAEKFWVDFDSSAHFPFLEQPDEFSAFMINLLKR